MILSTILGPPEAPPEQKAAEAADAPRRTLSVTRERGRRYRRVLAIGVIISVAVHLIAVFLSPLIIRYLETPLMFVSPPRAIATRPHGMEAVDVRVVERTEVEEPEPIRPEPQPEREVAPGPARPEPEEPVLSSAERLRPRVGDWRLWVAPPLPRDDLDRTPAERLAALEARIYAALEAGDDSLAAALAREADALNWTVGEDGNRWGISPGKLHLGPVTLPLPLMLGPHPATAREQADRAADWSAIQRQAGQGVIDETFEERVKAIRERKAREEAEKAKNDTTSSGGG